MNRVVLTSTQSDTYDFFLPIAARVWRTRMGYEPLIFLVGSWKEWTKGHCGVALGQLDKTGYYVDVIPHVPGVDDSNVSMSIRQHVAALAFLKEDDTILVGDIDLLPLQRAFYRYSDYAKYSIIIHHANMYDDRYWPAYGPEMSVAMWREVMGLLVGDLQGSLLKTFQEGGIAQLIATQKADCQDSKLWTFDEEYASAKIRSSRFFDGIVRVNSTPSERLCRHSWPLDPVASNYIDAHLPRPGWSEEGWPKIRALLAQIMPEDLPWLDRYVASYREAREAKTYVRPACP